MNLQIAFPSPTPGAVVDIKKGRSTISFTQADINFAMGFFTLIHMTAPPTSAAPAEEVHEVI